MADSSVTAFRFRFSDVAVAVAVILVVVMMIIPIPTGLLSFFLIFNITLSLIILMVSLLIQETLEFSVFPTMLLIMTLFRLSLNISTTRQILLNAYAGEVVQKFGSMVIGGNPVVGFIIFLILVVVQFIVITRGAERISEVAARFTLDAMPGKQMSIDADLNAGIITNKEARQGRQKIQQEADFYGSMDGATKFVRGDAIAALIILVINVLGGFIIGIVQKNMAFQDALQTYTLLTVGDGLVTQIPALLISTASGIIVTRTGVGHQLHLRPGQPVARLSEGPQHSLRHPDLACPARHAPCARAGDIGHHRIHGLRPGPLLKAGEASGKGVRPQP